MELEGALSYTQEPSLVHIQSETSPIYTIPSHLTKFHLNIIIHLRYCLSSSLFPPSFFTNNVHALVLSPLMLHALSIVSTSTVSF
jgi:hypothetical protein